MSPRSAALAIVVLAPLLLAASDPSGDTGPCSGHGSAAGTFAIPAANNFKIVAIPAKHITANADSTCESCHAGAGSSFTLPVTTGATFAKSAMSHAGITSNCVSCHGPTVTGSSFYGITTIVTMMSTTSGATSHVPSGTTCESCHAGTTPSTLVPANATKVVPGTLFLQKPFSVETLTQAVRAALDG